MRKANFSTVATLVVIALFIVVNREQLLDHVDSALHRLAGDGSTPFEQMALDLSGALASSRESDNQITALEEVAAHLNRNTPSMLDGVTRLDKVTAGPGKRLRFEHTILIAPETLTPRFLATVIEGRSRAEKLDYFCTDPESAPFRRDGVAVTWAYYDLSRKLIAEVSVSSADCVERLRA